MQESDRRSPPRDVIAPPEGQIFVGNLSFETTEQDIVEAFSRYGTITDCKLIIDRATGRSRGFSFLTFEDPQNSADAMIGMQGFLLQGRELRVDRSAPKGRSQRFNGGGFDSSNRGGGYGGGVANYDRGGDRGGYGAPMSDRDRSDRGGYPAGGDRPFDRDRGFGGDRGGYDRSYDRGPRGGYSERGGYAAPERSGGYPPADRSGGYPPADRSGGYPPADRSGGYPPADRSGGYPPADRSGGYPPADRSGGYSERGGYDRGAGGAASERPGYGYDNPDRGAYDRGYQRGPPGPGGPPKGVCFQWQKGDCRFGSSCRYSHDTPPGSGSAPAPEYSARGGYAGYEAP